jgi:hypothetical protein
MLRYRFPEQCALKDPTVACPAWTSLAEGNANFSIVIVFRYADDLMVGFEHREEAERLRANSTAECQVSTP